MRASILIHGITSLLLVAACGGKSEPAAETTPPVTETPATPETPPAAETAPPADLPFKDMSHEQRIAFMKQSVMPTMKPLFQEYDAKRYGELNCKTCHGAGAADGTFKMPNPALPVLPSPDKFAAFAKDPKNQPAIKFMAEKVKPTMARLLQKSEYDPKTNQGEFGCNACHVMQGAEPPKTEPRKN
jgi:hypothetical protein